MSGRTPGKAGCRSPAAMTQRLTYAGTCTDHQPRPSGAPKSWPHASIPSSCILIPVFLTACHLTTIWADHLVLRRAQREGSVSYCEPWVARYSGPAHRGSSSWPVATSPTGGKMLVIGGQHRHQLLAPGGHRE